MSAQPGTPLPPYTGNPNAVAPPSGLNAALYRVGGMHGRVLDMNGNVVHEMVEVTANVTIDRIAVPMVGTAVTGSKPGRESREGSITIQKLDSAWELSVYRYLARTLDERRALRGTAEAMMQPFSIILEHDDPMALGYEQWQLDGCLIWQLTLGINAGDELVQREYPLTWERETPLHAYTRTGAVQPNGLPVVQYVGALDQQAAA